MRSSWVLVIVVALAACKGGGASKADRKEVEAVQQALDKNQRDLEEAKAEAGAASNTEELFAATERMKALTLERKALENKKRELMK